jgi:hypothetical protein
MIRKAGISKSRNRHQYYTLVTIILLSVHLNHPNRLPSYVMLGDIRLAEPFSPKRMIVKISQITNHPFYRKPRKYNDIALIRLGSKVKFSRAIRPACLPQPKLRQENQRSFSTTGWGEVSYGRHRNCKLQSTGLSDE